MDTRWWILLFCCIIVFVTDLTFDQPSVVSQRLVGTAASCSNNTEIEDADVCLHLSFTQYNLLNSAYSLATAIFAIPAGLVVDKYGARIALFVAGSLISVGSLIFAAAAYMSPDRPDIFGVMFFAKFLYGAGVGGTAVITHRIKATWFLYKELALAFSLHLVAGRLGSTTAFLGLGALLEPVGLRGELWIGFLLNLVAAMACAGAALLNERAAKMVETSSESTGLGTLWTFALSVNGVYWSVAGIVFVFYGAVAVFTANGPEFLTNVYGFNESDASFVTGIVYYVSLLAPLGGVLMDRYGRREHWISGTSALLFFSLLLFLLIPRFPPILLTIFIGFGYAFVAPPIWSAVVLVVAAEHVGIGLGILKFMQNIGVSILTAFAGVILDSMMGETNWRGLFVYLMIFALLAFGCGMLVEFFNKRRGKPLSPSQAERSEHAMLQETSPIMGVM